MAVDEQEGPLEKIKDLFTQKPEDRAYEDAGGDDDVPEEDRTDDPKADAKRFALAAGEEDPYPDYTPAADEAVAVPVETTYVDTSAGVPVDDTPAPTADETATEVDFPDSGEDDDGVPSVGRSA